MITFEEYNELLNDIFELERKFFIKTDIYRLIEQKCTKKYLNPNERQLLNAEIHHSFEKLIKTMTAACPRLTNEDVIFCCLTKSGLDNSIICRSMGIISRYTMNQRKYRIKKKMKEANCDHLFEIIFTRNL